MIHRYGYKWPSCAYGLFNFALYDIEIVTCAPHMEHVQRFYSSFAPKAGISKVGMWDQDMKQHMYLLM